MPECFGESENTAALLWIAFSLRASGRSADPVRRACNLGYRQLNDLCERC